VENIILDGLELSAPVGGAPLIVLKNTRRAFLTGMRSPEGCKVFTQVSGPQSAGIEFVANSIPRKQRVVSYADGAEKEAINIG
ncbi:MAG: hypothetical protein ACRD25_03785, partial [Terracidiphilus sp.]